MSLQQLLIDNNIEIEEGGRHGSRGWVQINCPHCDDSTFHGGINLSGAYYHCWKCGGNSLAFTLSSILYVRKSEAESLIEEYHNNSALVKQHKKHKTNIKVLHQPGTELKKPHKKYLEKRNFDSNYLEKKYKLTGTIFSPKDFSYRVIIPVFHNKKLVAYQGRDFTGKNKLRYKGLSPDDSIIPYKHLLYGSQFAGNQIGIVEGVFDQWRMGDGFVCSFGTDLTSYQIRLISNYDKVFFLWDMDNKKVKQKATMYGKHIKAINPQCQVEVIDLELKDSDPGDLSDKEAKRIRGELNFL